MMEYKIIELFIQVGLFFRFACWSRLACICILLFQQLDLFEAFQVKET